MNKIVFDHRVKKTQEGMYYKVPFQVPEGVRAVKISYHYSKSNGNVIDFGLEDEKGQFLGWSGSSRSSINVSAYDATPGYFMENIKPGEWNILVGAYHVQDDGVSVRYEITFEENGYSWLFGDLHTHSDASDGQYDIPTLAKKAKAKGLDFLAVTNHNNYSENFSLPKIPGLTLIPGVEWTHYKGHMNFFGVLQPFSGSFIANSQEEMERLIQEARKNGATISVNHPKCPLCPYLWESEDAFQLIEVWNGPMRKANRDAIAWWTELLKRGRKIPAVGGSDYHRVHQPVKIGNPVTAVYAKSPSAKDIMEAVANGRSYISNDIKGVRLMMECSEKGFGEQIEIKERETATFKVDAANMPANSVLRLVDQNGVQMELTGKNGSVHEEIEIHASGFLYLLAVQKMIRNKERILAVSNPIYIQTK